MNFVFVREEEFLPGERIHLPADDRVERLIASMDLRSGTQFRVALENRGRAQAVVTKLGKAGLTADIKRLREPEEGPDIDLVLAIPRPKVLRRLIPRVASMGIRSVTLVNACGVLREYFDSHWLAEENLLKLLMLGLEQGGAIRVPTITQERRLRPFIEDKLGRLRKREVRILCAPNAQRGMPWVADSARVIVAIGPETGWTDFEEGLFETAGFRPFSLGPEHLASDVACLAMLGAVKAGLSHPS